ncbi:hypothetical protein MKX01_034713 [Papaver californicum]|nr:hypothetical protein MKX01_034713 [Papaver californicum]
MSCLTSWILLLLLLVFFSSTHKFSLFFPNKTNHLLFSSSQFSSSQSPVTSYFLVTKPIKLPPNAKPCLVLQHDFCYTYGKSPVLVNYKPPTNCPSKHFFRIVLEQLKEDNLMESLVSGVEIFTSCTALPTASGIIWTRYMCCLALLGCIRLAVYLGNTVDSTYTDCYLPSELVMPISRNLPLNDGLWFLVKNSTNIQSKIFTIPQNEYINAYNLTDTPGNGPFREVVVRLNGDEIGAVWPFTGGFNPLITAIGSFDLPSYDIEITPFLGKILDGKQHEFGFGVTNALNIDANFQIWLDHSDTTTRELIRNENPPSKISLVSKKKASYITSAIRAASVSDWVRSSHGNITANSLQDFSFTNIMTLRGSSQIVNQTIDASSRASLGHGNHTPLSYVSLGFDEKRLAGSSASPWVSSVLNNSQQGLGVLNLIHHLDGSDECYFWNVSSSNYTILYSISGDPCQQNRRFNTGFRNGKKFRCMLGEHLLR